MQTDNTFKVIAATGAITIALGGTIEWCSGYYQYCELYVWLYYHFAMIAIIVLFCSEADRLLNDDSDDSDDSDKKS